MYQGIHKTAMNDKLLNLKLHKPGDLVDYFMCEHKWPVCFFDFSFQQKLPSYFAYKTRDFPGVIMEDHFYGKDEETMAFEET